MYSFISTSLTVAVTRRYTSAASLPALNHAISIIVLKTAHGDINIQLKPDWSQSSVEYVQQVCTVVAKQACGTVCRSMPYAYR